MTVRPFISSPPLMLSHGGRGENEKVEGEGQGRRSGHEGEGGGVRVGGQEVDER